MKQRKEAGEEMQGLYGEIRKNRSILERRRPWPKAAEAQLLEWETERFIRSSLALDGKLLDENAVRTILAGSVVAEASFADYAEIQGLESATLYLRKLAGDLETASGNVLVSRSTFDKFPTEAELCLLWCGLEGKNEEEAKCIWAEKSHYRKLSPVLHSFSHVPCHFRELSDKMTEFYVWLKEKAGGRPVSAISAGLLREPANPLLLAAEAHNRLLALWPFEAHNEALARLFAEAVLLAYGLPLVPWTMTEPEYYGAERAYLDSVEREQLDANGFAAGSGVLAETLGKWILRSQGVALRLTETEGVTKG